MQTTKQIKEEKILGEIASRFPNNKHRGLGYKGLYLYQEMDLRKTISLTRQETLKEVVEKIEDHIKRHKEIDINNNDTMLLLQIQAIKTLKELKKQILEDEG